MDDRFWQLKESAKWSLDVNEKRHAIKELASSYGKDAIQAISEIKDVTAYDEIKDACIDAIKSAKANNDSAHQNKKNPKPKVKNSKKARKGKKKRNS